MNEDSQPVNSPSGRQPDMGRRRLIGYLLGFSVTATLTGVLTPIIGYLWPSSRISGPGQGRTAVGAVEEFPAGQGKVVPVNEKPVIVVRTTQGDFRAFSAICTHLGCITEWDQSRQFILCPCHDGRFNPLNGAVISGPAPSPLPQLSLTVEEGVIYVSEGQA